MKKFLGIIFPVFFIYWPGYSQFSFRNDKNYTEKQPYVNLFRIIEDSFQLPKNNNFELRLWLTASPSMDVGLFLLSNKKGKWTARRFDWTKMTNRKITEKPVKSGNLDQLWMELNKYHVLNIPESDKLKDSSGKEAYAPVLDGISYTIELIKRKKRGYILITAQT